MKILYTGYYRERSDWGEMTKNNILAIAKAGIDVVPRAINFGSGSETPTELKELESKSTEGCTIHIQHVFPNHIVKSFEFEKTIAILSNDFYFCGHSTYPEYLSLTDEVWMQRTNLSANALPLPSNVEVKFLAQSFNTEKFKKNYADITIPAADGKFKFYTKFTSGAEDQYSAILRAFHREFDVTEPVEIICCHDTEEALQVSERLSYQVKEQMGIRSHPSEYKKEILVPPSVDINRIHKYAHSFISTQRVSSVSVLDFDAMGFGNKPIVSAYNAGATDYFGESCHRLPSIFKGYKSVKAGDPRGRDFVVETCESSLQQIMRAEFKEWVVNPITFSNKRKLEGMKQADLFSIENSKIKEVLNV
jgi:hypothetical protein